MKSIHFAYILEMHWYWYFKLYGFSHYIIFHHSFYALQKGLTWSMSEGEVYLCVSVFFSVFWLFHIGGGYFHNDEILFSSYFHPTRYIYFINGKLLIILTLFIMILQSLMNNLFNSISIIFNTTFFQDIELFHLPCHT